MNRRARPSRLGASGKLAVAIGIAASGLLWLALDPTGGSARAESGPAAAQPVDVVFVLDNSGSMRQHDPAFLTRAAVVDFAAALADDPGVDGRVAIVLFDDRARLVQPLRRIPSPRSDPELDQALGALDFSGQRTHSPAGIERALYELRQSGRDGARQAIVLLSDGKIDTGDPRRDIEAARTLREDLAAESASSGIRIFGIAFTDAADYALMQALARRTRASYYRAFEAAELTGVVDDVLARVAEDEPPSLAEGTPTAPAPGVSDARAESGALAVPPAVSSGPSASGGSEREGGGTGLLGWLPLALLLAGGALLWRRRVTAARRVAESKGTPAAQLLDFGGQLGEAGAALSLRKGRTRIGRDPNNDIVIDDDTISSEHAIIEIEQGRYWLEDRRSTNGTRLGDRRLETGERVQLKGGDLVRFAELELKFVLAGYVPGGQTVFLSSSTSPPPGWSAVSWAVGDLKASSDAEAPDAEPTPGSEAAAGAPVGLDDSSDDDAERASAPAHVDDDAEARPAEPEPERDLADADTAPLRIETASRHPHISLLPDPEPEPEPEPESESEDTAASGAEARLDAFEALPETGAADPERPSIPQPGAPAPQPPEHAGARPLSAYRDCLDYHVARVAEISPDFGAFIARGFDDEIRAALSVTARDLLAEAHEAGRLLQREYTSSRIRYVICAVPGEMERAREFYVEAFGGFTRLLTEQLGADSFRADRCEILAVLSFGEAEAPWVSLSIVPDEGQDPRIDLLSYEFLTEQERHEIESEETTEISQSGLG